MDVPAPSDRLRNLVATPQAFVSLWPFLERVEDAGRKVTLVLSRFGFRMRVTYTVDVLIDESHGTIVYRCVSGNKLFEVRVAIKPSSNGSRLTIEASYSGPYEALSQPLLDRFVSELAARLANAAQQTLPTRMAGGRLLADPMATASIIVRGSLVSTGTINLSTEEDVATFVKRLAEEARKAGGLVLARVSGSEGCVRLLFQDGNLVDAAGEVAGEAVDGVASIDRLLESMRGRWRYMLIKAPT